MIGYFKIKSLSDTDSASAYRQATVESTMDSGIEGTLFLPPYLRQNQCTINTGSIVFGVLDDVSGLGVALYGKDCDFGYFFDADILIKKNLTVTNNITSQTGNIQATSGDVVATSISLKNHYHQIVTIPPQDCASIVAAASSGIAPAPLSATYTIIPS
jgi:ribonucleotide reductase alpha subunit